VVFVEPHCAHAGTTAIAELLEDAACALASVDAFVEPAQPPRRLGQQVEALRLGGRLFV